MRARDFLISLMFLPLTGFSQEEKDYQTDVTGFIKTDVFWDSRQTVDVRDGHFLLYPKDEMLDTYGQDINSKSKLSMLSIQTRLKGIISGPGILGANATGVIEGAFCGTINSTINSFRLRHAYAKLEWSSSEMIIGQYWHPFFLTSSFPDVVSFNTGAPFQPLSRNPQIRFSHNLGDFRAVVTALSQIDFKDAGPNEKLEKVASAAFLKNSVLPEFNLRVDYEKEDHGNGSALLLSGAANFKRLMPLTHLVYNSGKIPMTRKMTGYVDGFSTLACIRYQTRKMTIKLEGIYGQLLYSMTMLGGFGITNMDMDATSDLAYAPVNTSSVWTELHSNGEKWQGGIFLGYTKNHGSKDRALINTYSRGDNIENVFRISPRLIHNAGQVRIATELEYTVAAFGAADHSGRVHEAKEISNLRLLVGFYYFL
ncbi:MAG: hypothetical protein HKN87_10240 [Saprospiraceae bacterium]|nr:hypothetical protein [Saprospiraceae bacterium]